MKTGFDLNASYSPETNFEEQAELFAEALTAYIATRALDTAVEFAEHAGRKTITQYDLVPSLQYIGTQLYSDDNMMEEIKKIMENMRDDNSEYDSDDFSGSEEYSGSEESGSETSEVDEKNIKMNDCQCTVCTNIRAIHANWHRWNPTDPFQLSIKQAVDRMCSDELISTPFLQR